MNEMKKHLIMIVIMIASLVVGFFLVGILEAEVDRIENLEGCNDGCTTDYQLYRRGEIGFDEYVSCFDKCNELYGGL